MAALILSGWFRLVRGHLYELCAVAITLGALHEAAYR
jgi:hypothetical protein